MANRFGGKFSPRGGAARGDGTLPPGYALPVPKHRLQSRPKWITIAATPFLFSAFFQSPAGMIGNLLGFGLIAAAMVLTREGLLAEAAFDAQPAARRPAFPRKLLGGAMAGIGLGMGAAEPGALIGAVMIGVAGTALHWLSFGADPLRSKGMDGADGFQHERANRLIEDAQILLDQMHDAIARTADRRLQDRMAQFDATVRSLFAQLRQNPANLSALRRYLGVYLVGARDATVKFTDLYTRTHDQTARAAYEGFLDDLERDFTARRQELLDGGRMDLDIEMSVLRDRLAREGVRPAAMHAANQGASAPDASAATASPARLMSDDALNLDAILNPDRDKVR